MVHFLPSLSTHLFSLGVKKNYRLQTGQNFREICWSPDGIFTQWWKKISWTFNLRQKMIPTCFSSSPPFSLLNFFSTSDSFSGLLLSSLKLSIPRKEEFSIFAEFLDGLELLESVDWKKEKKKWRELERRENRFVAFESNLGTQTLKIFLSDLFLKLRL